MNQIRLHSNGEIVHQGKAVKAKPLCFLGHKVDLDQDWTLRSFFRMLETYPVFSELNTFIPTFHKQYQMCPKQNCLMDSIDYLELQRTVEMIGFPGDPGLEMYVSLKGVHKGVESEVKSYWLETLLDLPVKLGRLNHIVFGDTIDTFKFETVFNLFELIDGIVWELSFHNMPASCHLPL